MYHIVYLTTNLVNQKIYIGIHSTYNLNDGYLGSGIALTQATRKYGVRNFKTQILYYCMSRLDALELESMIVDSQFINRLDTYNISIGGVTYKSNNNPFMNKFHTDEQKMKWCATRKGTNSGIDNPMYGKTLSRESKDKISQARIGKDTWNKGKTLQPLSEECKNNISLALKAKEKITCEFCGRKFDAGNFKKHHGERCKSKV